jgi:anti-sigma regulatory factor (Ser/Thr protein kinase)
MGQTHSWSYVLTLSAEATSASMAREFVSGHLLRHGLAHLVEDLRLVVSELVTNAIVHAQTRFSVILRRVGPSVVLTVQDRSTSAPRMVGGTEGNRMDLGGRGLLLVDALSHDWGVKIGAGRSKAVWAAFSAEDGEAVAAP